MGYRRLTLICPDCGKPFTGTTAPKLQRDFQCAITFMGHVLALEHDLKGLSLGQIRDLRAEIAEVKRYAPPVTTNLIP